MKRSSSWYLPGDLFIFSGKVLCPTFRTPHIVVFFVLAHEWFLCYEDGNETIPVPMVKTQAYGNGSFENILVVNRNLIIGLLLFAPVYLSEAQRS